MLTNKASEGAVESEWWISDGVFVSDHIIFCVLLLLCCLPNINPMIVLLGWDGWNVYFCQLACNKVVDLLKVANDS